MYDEEVKEFMNLNGHETPAKLAPELALLRLRLIQEELTEIVIALQENDIIGVADGLADLKYVIVGTALAYDMKLLHFPSQLFELPPSLGNAAARLSLANELIRAMADLPRDLMDWPISHDLVRILNKLNTTVETTAVLMKLPLYALFLEVHASNMTKSAGRSATVKGGLKGESYRMPDIAGVLMKARLV
jgi:predicted HAD superfamily Cof-like phosphohydrolase